MEEGLMQEEEVMVMDIFPKLDLESRRRSKIIGTEENTK